MFLSLSISGIVNAGSNTFYKYMQYVCYITHKQASVNKWISKQIKKKILLETLKITCEEVHVQ